MEKTFDYIINVGDRNDDLQPYLAAPSKEEGIKYAKQALMFYRYTEVVYMPEDDVDTNEVVWRSWNDED